MLSRGFAIGAIVASVVALGAGVARRASAEAEMAGTDPFRERAVVAPDYASLVTTAVRTKAKRDEDGFEDGRVEAERKLAKGALSWRVIASGGGKPSPETMLHVSMEQVLERDFEVDVISEGGGCIPIRHDGYFRALMTGHNAVMKPAIEKRHGRNVWAVAEARARKETQANQARGISHSVYR